HCGARDRTSPFLYYSPSPAPPPAGRAEKGVPLLRPPHPTPLFGVAFPVSSTRGPRAGTDRRPGIPGTGPSFGTGRAPPADAASCGPVHGFSGRHGHSPRHTDGRRLFGSVLLKR